MALWVNFTQRDLSISKVVYLQIFKLDLKVYLSFWKLTNKFMDTMQKILQIVRVQHLTISSYSGVAIEERLLQGRMTLAGRWQILFAMSLLGDVKVYVISFASLTPIYAFFYYGSTILMLRNYQASSRYIQYLPIAC